MSGIETRWRSSWSLLALAICLGLSSSVRADEAPPLLTRLQLEAFTVDSSAPPSFVRLQIDLQDPGSGVCLDVCDDVGGATQVKLRHIASGQRRNAPFELQSGSLQAGTFAAAVALPPGSAGGIWVVEELWLADMAGNRVRFNTADLINLPALTQVLNVAGDGDAAPPSLTSITVDSITFDSTTDTSVEVTMNATDSQSGLCLAGCSDDGGPTQIRYVHATTGQVRDGLFLWDGADRYLASIEFPSGSAGGSWRVAALQLVDLAGNRVSFSRAELDTLGYSTALFNQSTTGDLAAPTLVSLSFLPEPVDTTGGPQTALVTMEAADDLAGICDVPWCGDFGTTTQVRFRRDDSDHVRHALFSLMHSSR